MKLMPNEKEVIVETKQKGKPSIFIRTIQSTPALFMDYIHNKILEAKKEGKHVEVSSYGR
jgi:hypothetical protein